jgi:protein NrfD
MPGELQIPLWEWWIVLYFFTGGIAGGAYFTSAILELVGGPEDRPVARMGYYIAFALLPVCVIALIADLGEPLRFWHMMVYSRTLLPWPKWDSPISVGAYALLFFGLFAFLSFVDALIETGRLPWASLREKYSGLPRKIYATIGALFGFFVASYTGVLLAHTHLPVWANTPMLGALFAASAASTGMAAIALGLAITRAPVTRFWARLRQAEYRALILELILLIIYLVWLGSAAQPILTGLNGILLIGGTGLLGLIIPLVLNFRPSPQKAESGSSALWLMALLVLIGGLLMRTVIVMGGQNLL